MFEGFMTPGWPKSSRLDKAVEIGVLGGTYFYLQLQSFMLMADVEYVLLRLGLIEISIKSQRGMTDRG